MTEMVLIRKKRQHQIASGIAIPFVKDLDRAKLIDWLIYIHEAEQMMPETLHITIAIVDKGLLI